MKTAPHWEEKNAGLMSMTLYFTSPFKLETLKFFELKTVGKFGTEVLGPTQSFQLELTFFSKQS